MGEDLKGDKDLEGGEVGVPVENRVFHDFERRLIQNHDVFCARESSQDVVQKHGFSPR